MQFGDWPSLFSFDFVKKKKNSGDALFPFNSPPLIGGTNFNIKRVLIRIGLHPYLIHLPAFTMASISNAVMSPWCKHIFSLSFVDGSNWFSSKFLSENKKCKIYQVLSKERQLSNHNDHT